MIDFIKVALKWQKKWDDKKVFKTKEGKNKFYCLEFFPYPSGAGLHLGHVRNYTIGDACARYKRMQGYNVLYPMGYDSFGLPAENAAIKNKVDPKKWTQSNIKTMKAQQKALGFSYDWSREISTCEKEYYKWNQYFFLKFLEKGIAYRKKAPVNWCNACNTVLANEQVVNGCCWRHEDTKVESKQLEQWFFKITDYADELLSSIDTLDGWPEKIKTMQKNWIGKSQGTKINFPIKDSKEILEVFTTRPDTLFGVTFVVLAPEHPLVLDLVKGTKYEKEVKKFIDKVVLEEKFTRTAEDKEKEGMFIGKYAIHPLTKEEVPIYIANFVLLEYGSGAVMAVPAHDQRDFDFAKKYKIPIKTVITPNGKKLEAANEAYTEGGILINSSEFNNLNNDVAKKEITKFLEKNKLGKSATQYKLRDWLISRQRYWGTPIPIIYCDKCGIIPVPEKNLPVVLPEDVKFGAEGNPLLTSKSFVNTKCPKCKSNAKRETDTMDTFVDSSWYFLRFTNPGNNKAPFDKKKAQQMMPLDMYIGGAEHAVMHLLYARFFTKVLRDLKFINLDEPIKVLKNQGIITKEGAKMSKSLGNAVDPLEITNQYGADTLRLFILFVAAPESAIEWSDKGIEGCYKFLKKVENLSENISKIKDKKITSKENKAIEEITLNIESFEYNSAINKLMAFANYLQKSEKIPKESYETLLLLLSPFAPHITEELWEKIGNKPFISLKKWPKADKSKIDLALEYEDSLLESTVYDIKEILKLVKIDSPQNVSLFIAEQWKYDFMKKINEEIEKTRDISTLIKKSLIKNYEKEIAKLVPSLVKDQGKIPSCILSSEKELEIFKNNMNKLEKEFNCKIFISYSKDSNELKAKQSLPGKPSIIVNL